MMENLVSCSIKTEKTYTMVGVVLVLFWFEIYLMGTHLIVLAGLFSINIIPWWMRLGYFTFDASVVMSSYVITRANFVLISIHLIIHFLAIIELMKHYSHFFKDVYEMAEQRYDGKSRWTVIFYIMGTLEDVATHGVNAWLLYHGIYFKN